MCEAAGFEATYLGGYMSTTQLDARLDPEHRNFLAAMTFGEHGYPMDRDMHAGIGGTYRLRRPAEERD
jgi:hypothetical protein